MASITSTMSRTTVVSDALSSFHSAMFRRSLASLLEDTELHLSNVAIQAAREIEWLGARPGRFYETIDVSVVLKAMLDMSYTIGDTDSTGSLRYTSCAIAACNRGADDSDERQSMLMELGEAWITHFLFPLKHGGGRKEGPPSQLATPRAATVHAQVDEGASSRQAGFPEQVLARDNSTCFFTGYPDFHHLPPNFVGYSEALEAAHIIKRSVAVFDSPNRNNSDYLSAVGTLEIIRNYADLPVSFLDDIANTIDDPENGVTLAPGPHGMFNRYRWYLKPTDVRNQYRITGVGNFSAPDKVVTFLDRSQEGFSVPVPNPRYLALHGAVAQILHMSRAGKAIDAIIDRFNRSQEGVPLDHKYRTGSDFRAMVSSLCLVTPLA